MKIVVVGAGINGVTASLELTRRGHTIILVDPGPLPHPLAASTDISKAVRAAYGPDEDYTDLAERSVPIWRKWNVELGTELYHETGFLFMRQREMQPRDFEWESLEMLKRRGHRVERIGAQELPERYPAWNTERFCDGFLESEAGYVESGRVLAALLQQARAAGVELREAPFAALAEGNDRVKGVFLRKRSSTVIPNQVEGARSATSKVTSRYPSTALGMTRMGADVVVMTTGAWTPILLPWTNSFFRAIGQPVFHLRPKRPELFATERFPVFGADITSTGYYGFPLNRDGVVKIGNHGPGREMSPDSAERLVSKEEEERLREFLSWAFPDLADAEIVYSRICLYCDTHDGNFWIARDPERKGLVIAAGDCGHGFKFAPVLGEIIADAVEEKENPFVDKFRWRPDVQPGVMKEAARRAGSG